MAIYRPPKARWPLALGTGIAGLVLGLVVGFALGGDDFDPADAGRQLDAILIEAAGSLEVAGVEYEESVADGEVTNQAEFDGSLGAVARSRSRFEEARPALEALVPAHVEEIEGLYEGVESAMESRTDPAEVVSLLEELENTLAGGRLRS